MGDDLVRVEKKVDDGLVRVEREVGGVLVRVEREVGDVLVYVSGVRCVQCCLSGLSTESPNAMVRYLFVW